MTTFATTFDTEVDQLIDSVIDSLVTAVPVGAFRAAADDRLLVSTGALERLGRVVDARRVEAAGEIQHRSRIALGTASLAVRKGCRDAVELLRRINLASTTTVRRHIKLGTQTRPQTALSGDVFPAPFPHIAAAIDAGMLGVDAATAIITELAPTLLRADFQGIDGAEAELVAAATGTGPETTIPCTADEIREQATVWRAYLDQDGTLPTEERAMTRRSFSPGTYNSADNLIHGKYALMPEIHAKLGRVFDACLSPKTGPTFLPKPDKHKPGTNVAGVSSSEPTGPVETRTPDQQRHDILAAMIDGFARSGTTPTIGGASPTVLVSVRAENLNTGHGAGFVSLGGPAGETIPLSLRTVTQMICTGGTQTITLGNTQNNTQNNTGAIIELGSEQRCFTPAQRRAITLRDGGCIIPGCTIPAAWTEIHHVTPDAKDGPTHTDNGCLVCWFHHRTIETSGWNIRMINATPHVKAPTWLHGDGLWHPATRSPTRKYDTITHTTKKRAKKRANERAEERADERADERAVEKRNNTSNPPTDWAP